MPKKHKNRAVHLVEEEEEEEGDEIAVKKSRTNSQIPTDEARKAKKSKKNKVELKIETVKGNPDKISPLLGYFPSGYDPLKQQQQQQRGSEQPRVRILKNVKRTNRMQLVVSPTESPVEFVGTNYTGEATTPQVCTYALGIVDKQTRTLKIVQIEANKIFRLEPKVGESHLTEDAPLDGVKEETAVEKANKSLKYTTSKTQRREKILWDLRRNQDPESQKELDKKLDGIGINEAAATDTTTTNARNIPPHDMQTDNVTNAYPIHKIISVGEWNYLNDIVELLQAGKEVERNSYPIFVCNRVHILDEMKDEEAKLNLAGIFSYISHLIKFKDKYSMDGFSSAKNHKFPSILSQKFSTLFADSDSKKLADDKRSLLISYVLVLTLIADRFKTDPSDIAKDLRMNPVALRAHFEYLGCKLKREGSVLLAELKAPLQFPAIRMKRRR